MPPKPGPGQQPHLPSHPDQVKHAQAALTKATQLELAGNYDDAFRLYVSSAQSFLHLSRTSPAAAGSSTDPARLKALAKRALDRAEKIKAAKKDLTPVKQERLAREVQAAVLDRSALIGGRRYPLWSDRPAPLAATATATGPPASAPAEADQFTDPDGLLSLSAAQQASLAAWHRPPALHAGYHLHLPDLRPEDLVQETITDCSVVAALTVCVAHNRRFGGALGRAAVHAGNYGRSQDQDQGADDAPRLARDGRYEVALMLNGARRSVIVDDLLPTRENGCLLCVSTRGKKALWPSLVEKAYLKVMGGYDFEGSNGSIDLYAITGWIPEHLRIVDAKFQREKAWRRLRRAFNAGQCLMTVGTGRAPGMFRDDQLTPFHAYAVIDVSDDDTARVVSLWNPWGKRTEGPRSAKYSEGPIRMAWDDLCGIFDSIYLNWDPGIFPHRAIVHSAWQPSVAQGEEEPWTSNHQFNVTFSDSSADETELWVLLSRHITGNEEDQSFIAAHVFHAAEAEAVSVMRPALEATYTDSPHVLVRTTRFPEESTLSVIASRHGSGAADAAYTLSVFSFAPFTLSEPAHVYSFSQWVEGSFAPGTAGGNALQPTFMRNPQFALTVRPAGSVGSVTSPNGAQLRLSVHGSKDLPLHVQVVWGRGERVFDLRQIKVIKDSGTYNYGFGLCEMQIPSGTYTVIVSSFEPRTLGDYKLHVECSQSFDIKPIPQEGAGMFSKRIQGTWSSPSDAHPPLNPTYALVLASPTHLTVRLQLVSPTPMTPIKVSLHTPTSQNTPGAEVADSGGFSDSVAGAVIQNVKVDAGTYVLVPSIVSSHVEAEFVIQVYSTACSIKSRQLG